MDELARVRALPLTNFHCTKTHAIYRGAGNTRSFSDGIGDGPQRSVIRSTIHLSIADEKRWTLRGDYYVPIFLAIIVPVNSRLVRFWSDGILSAIHYLRLGHGPDPVSPWMILAVILGAETSMDIPLDYICHIDPKSAKILQPWFKFSASDVLHFPQDFQHPVVQLLFQYVELDDVRERL